MQKVKKLIIVFLSTFGGSVLLYTTIIQLKDPNSYSVNMIWALALNLAIINASSMLIFKTGVSKKSLWIRRIIVIGILCITVPGSVILLGVVNFEPTLCFKYIGITTGSIVVLSIILYIIADTVERKKIDKINAKLNENK